MDEVWVRITASVVCSVLFCIATIQLLGAMQQSGYKGKTFLRWLARRDNLYFNRLWVWALCLVLACFVTSLCFSFLGKVGALAVSAAPFFALGLLFAFAEKKYALKVSVVFTKRLKRLFVAYVFVTAVISYTLIAVLYALAKWNGSEFYAVIAYVPFNVMPLFLPLLLCLANGLTGIFENAKNKKFIEKAEKVLNERDVIRVGVVGSFGKTSIKNILQTILSVKYRVAATPSSYNTPIGIARSVFSKDFETAEVFIAEMGARRKGNIKTLCSLVKPGYGVFTGICPQHVETFESIQNIWEEKSEILKSGAITVCGESLKPYVLKEFADKKEQILFPVAVKDVCLQATKTTFTLLLDGEEILVETSLLGSIAVENIALCVTLARQMGLTKEEIEKGIKNITPIKHRLELLQSENAYILDDGYNSNIRGATEALAALRRFPKRKCVITPGIIECGILEEEINTRLGEEIAKNQIDLVILVGETLVNSVKKGYVLAGGEEENIKTVKTLEDAKAVLSNWIESKDAVLFLNDLPDVY